MRHKGSISHTCQERDRIVPLLFRKATDLVQWPASVMDICKKAANLPVKEFYISSDAAIEYVRHRYYWNERKKFRSSYKQMLYDELYERFEKRVNLPENANKSLPDIVITILATSAPCCGLTPLQLYTIMLQHRKKLQRKKK